MDANPYAAPLTTATPPPLASDADLIRREHIKHEASVKGVGSLYFIGSLFLVIGGGGMIIAAVGSKEGAVQVGMLAILPALGILGFWVGHGLRKLSPAARVVAGVLTGINLLISVFGLPKTVLLVLINTYILNLLFSKKGAMVFSAPYKEIIAATPYIKYKTSIVVWIVLGIFVLVILAGVGIAIFGSLRH